MLKNLGIPGSAGRPAKLLYQAGDFKIMSPGGFVICAVTGAPIPLEELRYWSVDLQEPYKTPEASLKRYLEVREEGAGKD